MKDELEKFPGTEHRDCSQGSNPEAHEVCPGQDKEEHQCSRDQLTPEKGGTPV